MEENAITLVGIKKMDAKSIAIQTIMVQATMANMASGGADTTAIIILLQNDVRPVPLDVMNAVLSYHDDLVKWNNEWEDHYKPFGIIVGEVIQNENRKGTLWEAIDSIVDANGSTDVEDNPNNDLDDWQNYFIQITYEKFLIISYKKEEEATMANTMKGYFKKVRILNNHS